MDRLEKIYGLWDELADRPLAESRAPIELLFGRLAEWIGVDDAPWIGIVRVKDDPDADKDVLYGWCLRAAERWIPRPEYDQQFIRKVLAHMERDPGMSIRLWCCHVANIEFVVQ